MDFFESQDDARKNTRRLILLFIAAVASIVVLTNLLLLAVANYSNTYTVSTGQFNYSWEAFAGVTIVVVTLIGLGSLFRIISLSKGGAAVAEMLDGKLLVDGKGDFKKQRLLNVVEEMAIASGTPVPPVYLISDKAINAFAAGFSPGDAVIGVTEGAIDNLDRDQLQGVIAHEFSHILNGDMRLNIRLIGVLYGVLMLAIIGRIMLGARHSGSSKRDSGGAIIAIGLGLFVLGYVGRFFGSVIKAAVSRQREFLADASAVQFTRNPEGIGGALKRIGGYDGGTVVDNANSEEMSHAFFCEGVHFTLTSIMATHPPLTERIKRIDPRWDGGFIKEQSIADKAPASGPSELTSGFAGPTTPAEARAVIGAIPAVLSEAARETYSSRAVVYLLLLDRDETVRVNQIDHLQDEADVFVFSRFRELVPFAEQIEPHMRLPLLEMAMPSLRQLSRDQYDRFLGNIDALIKADNKVGLTEWALQKFVTKHLGEAFDRKHSKPRVRKLASAADHCAVLLSMLAYCDASSSVDPEIAFEKGREKLGLDISLVDKKALSLTRLNTAVDELADLRPLVKPKLLKACVATVCADDMVTPVEAELVRAIADSLDCPLPSLQP